MKFFNPIFQLFERWIDPFVKRNDYEPPNRLLYYVWHYVGQAKSAFAVLAVLGIIIAVVEAAMFAYVGELVDLLAEFESTHTKDAGWEGLINHYGPTLMKMLFVVVVFRLLLNVLDSLVEEQAIVPGFFVLMRWQSHKHIIGQSVSFFQNDLAGRISQKVFQSGNATGDMMISLLQVIWFILVYAATTIGILFTLKWQLGGIVIAWVFSMFAVAYYFVPKVRDHARITADTGASVTGRMVDAYSNIQTVKLHGSEAREEDGVYDASTIHRNAIIKFTRVLTGLRITANTVNSIALGIIGYMVVDLWLTGESSLGAVAFVLALSLRLRLLLNRLLGNLNGLFRNIGVTQNTMELVAQPHGLRDIENAAELDFKGGAIKFENVSFHYDKTEGVLHDFSLEIRPGEKIGVVGPSGSGKTTLASLMMRFFDPEKGAILVDGQDIAKVSQNSLRRYFSFVQQDAQLFNRTVRENIAYGTDEATDEAVEAAAKLAFADEFIQDLDDGKGGRGYQAKVGERGVKLSGGQRQRLAIARAIFRNAPIYVLDEATSQLDSGLEVQIQNALANHFEKKTVIIIAHRLSTLAKMDRIIVMDKGKIVQTGTHSQLTKKPGLYKTLWEKQSQYG